MNLGAEPKKVAILGGLLLVGGVALYLNVFSGDSGSSAPPPTPRAAVVIPATPNQAQQPAGTLPDTRRTPGRGNPVSGELIPRQGPERPEDRPDPTTIDPTLRLDLLAKIENVEPEASMRNVFQYGVAAPPPSAAKPIELPKGTPKIPIKSPPPPGSAKPAAPSGPAPPAGAPAISFKYYGYKISKVDGRKEAFLLDGDDIIIAGENEEVKRGRYKVVSIGLTSITIEDMQLKSTQTLKIQEEAAAA